MSGLAEAHRLIAAAVGRSAGRPVLVCIDGHSAAGKSTVADQLAAAFGAAVVPGDHFYRVMDEADRARLTPSEGADRYYDAERMDREALAPLADRMRATYRPYDWATGELSDPSHTIEPADVVIVEGLFVSRPELRHRYAVRILVETDPDERWRRQLARADASDAWLRRWDAAERHHLTAISPPEVFDAVVRGEPT